MQRAVLQLTQPISEVLIDGNKAPNLPYPTQEIIKGDATVPQIMAASILAKVARDHYMQKLSLIYPQYQFEKHKGYPTKLHRNYYQNLVFFSSSQKFQNGTRALKANN